MNADTKNTELRRHALAIGIWENEGGAPARDMMGLQYGRRIETDHSWTVYHVFTGAAARIDGDAKSGLSRSEATDSMLSLNHRNLRRRKELIKLLPSSSTLIETPSQP